MNHTDPKPSRAGHILLSLGALLGLLLAMNGLLTTQQDNSGALPAGVIAQVGDRLISEQKYQQVLQDLAADKRASLNDDDYQFVLQRMIDEELLILHGIELGLPASVPEVRKSLATAVIAQVAAESESHQPGDDELRALYESDAAFFRQTDRYKLSWWVINGTDDSSMAAAQQAVDALRAGTALEIVMASNDIRAQEYLPMVLLPQPKLADYLGPQLALEVPRLEPGEYSQPLLSGNTINILYLHEKISGQSLPFEQLRPQLEAEFRRRAGSRALQEYLEMLRRSIPVIRANERG